MINTLDITRTQVLSRHSGQVLDANYKPSKAAIAKVASVVLMLAECEQSNKQACVIITGAKVSNAR